MGHQIDRNSGSFNKVVVIGLGQLGFPVAKYAKDKGFDVSGYDINAFAMEQAEKELGIKRITSFEDIDVFIVCVSTHRSDDIFSPQVEGIFSVVQKISKEAKKGSLLSIESNRTKRYIEKGFGIFGAQGSCCTCSTQMVFRGREYSWSKSAQSYWRGI